MSVVVYDARGVDFFFFFFFSVCNDLDGIRTTTL